MAQKTYLDLLIKLDIVQFTDGKMKGSTLALYLVNMIPMDTLIDKLPVIYGINENESIPMGVTSWIYQFHNMADWEHTNTPGSGTCTSIYQADILKFQIYTEYETNRIVYSFFIYENNDWLEIWRLSNDHL